MKKNRFQFMKVHWENYMIHTMGLSTAEFGAMMLITGRYWMTGGPIPDDDCALSRTTRQSLEAWQEMRPRVMAFFKSRDGYLVSDHIDDLLEEARTASERQRARVMKRWGYGQGEDDHVVIQIDRNKKPN